MSCSNWSKLFDKAVTNIGETTRELMPTNHWECYNLLEMQREGTLETWVPVVTEYTAHCPPFGKPELAGLTGQSLASNSIAHININENFVILKTGSINGAGDSLTVSGTINGTSYEITINTGSNISIVRPDILKDVDRSLLQPVHSYIRTVTGNRLQYME